MGGTILLVAAAAVGAVAMEGSGAASAAIPTRVIVKLAPSVREAPDLLARQGRSMVAVSAPFDELCRRYRARDVRPLRTADVQIASAEDRRAHERARRRPRVRTQRATTPSFASTYVLELAPGVDAEEAAREFAALDVVVYAEPDRERHLQALPNDPYLSSFGSWGQDFDDLWGLHVIAAPDAWDISRGDGIVVAITDTGIDTTHPDLTANIWVNTGEIPGNGIDDDANGYVDDIHGWNSVGDDPNVSDDNGHGSHTAGTVAAIADNGIGIAGVAYESRLMAVKGFDANGSGFDSNLAEGILYAIENGARVINASWGGGGEASQTLTEAIELAHAEGVVFVASAGNDSSDVDRTFPANLRSTLAISAFNHLDELASFSNYGAKIDLAAPGGGDAGPSSIFEARRSILSVRASGAIASLTGSGKLVVGGSYLRQAGTSMAAPHVSGAAAVLLSIHPEFSVEQVRQALRQGADDVGTPGFDLESGYGRLNLVGALSVDPLEAHIASPEQGAKVGESELTLTGAAGGPGFVSYRIEYSTAADPDAWIPAAGPFFSEVADGGVLAVLNVNDFLDGGYGLRLLVDHVSGSVFEDRSSIVVNRVFLTDPTDESIFRGDGNIEIRGTIAPPDLIDYSVQYRLYTVPATPTSSLSVEEWTDSGITLAGGGSSPVYDGVLATFDPSVLPRGTRLTFRVTINKESGTTTRSILGVIVDPTLKAGWPRQLSGPLFFAHRVASMLQSAPTLIDLDGNGDIEILVSDREHVYAFRPDGSGLPGWPATLERDPFEILLSFAHSGPSVGDLDGDGDLEVVAARGQLLHVFDHEGNYVAGWPRRFSNLFGGDAALADLDGDGAAEIIFRTGKIYRDDPNGAIHAVCLDGSEMPGFPTDPAGSRYEGCCFAGSLAGYDHSVSVGDIDGDGSPDIVASWSAAAGSKFGTRKRRLFALDAQGRLKPRFPKNIGKKPFPYPRGAGPVLADLDQDGVLDIAIGRHTNVKRVYALNGNGRRIRVDYDLPRFKSEREHDMYDPMVAADITGDGVPELFLPTNLHARPACSGCGSPRMEDHLVAVTPGKHAAPLPGWPESFAFFGAQKEHGAGTPAVGDIDGDGEPEVVVGTGVCSGWNVAGRNCYAVWAFNTDGSVVPGFPKPTVAPNTSALASPAIADLDGDGIMEVVLIDVLANIMVYEVPSPPGPKQVLWPMARHNPAHTNALPVVTP